MKQICLLLTIAILIGPCLNAQVPDTIRKFYPDGRPAVYHLSVEGKPTGQWLEWYPNGTLRFDAEWKDGMGHGLWRYFHANGQVSSETVYVRDLPVGVSLEYYDNGQVATKTAYLNGLRDGREEHYLPDGQLDRVDYFIAGQPDIRIPKIFAPGVISSPKADEFGLAFSPSGDTLYLTRREPEAKQRIYLSFRKGGRWSAPQPAPWSDNRDEGAAVSPDGQYLVFASYRTKGAPKDEEALMDMNLWRVDIKENGWSAPYPLPGGINQDKPVGTPWARGYETGPSFAPNGNLYYWSAGRQGNDPDLLLAQRQNGKAFSRGEEVMALNTPGSESGATVSPDGQYLIFSAYGREDGFGGEDLYASRRQKNSWSTPINLGPTVNTVAEEGGAHFSPDGKYLYFSRGREGQQADIFYLNTRHLSLPR